MYLLFRAGVISLELRIRCVIRNAYVSSGGVLIRQNTVRPCFIRLVLEC